MMQRTAPVFEPLRGLSTPRPSRNWLGPVQRHQWLAGTLALAVVSLAFVVLTGMRPAFDAYGWLVWGHQALHLDLNTYSAPSWKPLPFLFTFPYGLLGRTALWLWMETAVMAALAGPVFGGRIAYRLVGEQTPRTYAWIAGLIAGLGVLGLEGYGHFILIASSDPMIVTLCLVAIDCHLSGRRRLAWAALILAALGRPEVWLMVAGYGLWLWRYVPEMRRMVALGVVAIAALWFVIPGLTSPSWTIAGDVAQSTASPFVGSRLTGVLQRFLSLYELPMQLAALLALGLAIIRRETTWLLLAGAAVAWLAVEIAFAYHGWPASPRYMFEPASIAVVLAGAGIGRLLAITAPRRRLRWVGFAVVAALVITMAPHAQIRARLFHNGVVLGKNWSKMIHRLDTVIARDGGSRHILACGQAVTEVSWQSIMGWEMNQNVASIGWAPEKWVERGRPMVLFEPHAAGWIVTPINIPRSQRGNCERLAAETAFN